MNQAINTGSNKKIRILHIDDNVLDCQIIHDVLQKEHNKFEIIVADSREKLEKQLTRGKFELVLSDIIIPGFDMLQVLQTVKEKEPDLSIIIVTGEGSEEIAVQAMKMGASDYITKSVSHIKGIAQTIERVIENKKKQEESKNVLIDRDENEEIFRSLFEKADVALFLSTPDGSIYSANDYACSLFGLTREEICNAGRNGLIDSADPRLPILMDKRKKTGPVKGELTCIKKDGSTFEAEVSFIVFLNKEGNERTSLVIRDLTEQKLAEENIRQERIQLRTLIDNLPDAIYFKDNAGRKLIANSADLKLMNCSSESEIIGKTDLDIFEGDPGVRGFNEDMNVLKTGKALSNHEDSYIDADGNQHWRLITKIPLFNDRKQITGLVGIGHDITGRKLAEKELAWEQYLMHSLLENIPDTIYFKDLESRFIRINQSMAKLFGLENPLQAIGKTDDDFFKSDHSVQAFNDEQEIIRSGKPIIGIEELETWFDRPPTWVSTTKMPLIDSNGAIIGTFGISRNIDELKKTEELLLKAKEKAEESESHFHSLFENMVEGFAYCKMLFEEGNPVDFIYLEVNHSFEPLTGLKNVMGKRVSEVVPGIQHSDTELFRIYGRVSLTGKPERFEMFVNGLNDWYSISVYSPQKEYFVAVFDVITERKNIEKELIRSKNKAEESDQLKTAFLHNISHEIRTPLNAIVGFSGLLKTYELNYEQRCNYTELIIKSSDQLLAIITDIINIASIESGQAKIQERTFNLNEVIELLHKQFYLKSKKYDIAFNHKTELEDKAAFIVADQTKLIEILSNLIGNAIKFTSQGSVDFGYRLQNDLLEFYVIDTGIGIPPEMHEEIFKRFRQVETALNRQYSGSGLGLSISKAYIELLGGKIWLNSEPGKGSGFYFTLPYKKANLNELSEEKDQSVSNTSLQNQCTILVVEDEDSNYLLLVEMLSGMGINFIRATNGKMAIELCKENPQIELVLMDIKMPEMDGYEATKRIKEMRKDLPVIAQTAYSADVDRNKAIASGCSDFIVKPFDRELLKRIIIERLSCK